MVSNGQKDKDLPEYNLIKNPFPFWLWLAVLAVAISLILGIRSWYTEQEQVIIAASPALQVTNREFSLFLWQNPEYLRPQNRDELGYLQAFNYDQVLRLDPEVADQYVVAPDEVLFLYHVWHSLLGKDYISTAIPALAFRQFLEKVTEWQPKYWSLAPKEYVEMVSGLSNKSAEEDLSRLSEKELPLAVRQAFQGWKNYFIENGKINQLQPTFLEMQNFLKEHPHYARNYWRNILSDTTPKYLLTLFKGEFVKDHAIPQDELTLSLKSAFYNFQKNLNHRATEK